MTNQQKEKEKIGRNSPCHCGSGKKYKKCCLENDEKNESRDLTNEHYQRIKEEKNLTYHQLASRKALDWAFEKHEDVTINAVVHFIGGPELKEAKNAFPEEEGGNILSQLLNEYALLDYEDEKLNSTLLKLYLQEKDGLLNKEEKESLRIKLNTYKTLYEVQKIIKEHRMFLKDYFSGENFWVKENRGTVSVKKWDIIFARVETYHDGTKKLTGSVVGFPRESETLNDLKRQYEKDQKLFGNNNEMWLFNFRHLMTPLIFQNIVEYYSNFASNVMSGLINKDGDELIFCEKTADISDYQKIDAYFEKNDFLTLTHLDEKEKVYNWLDEKDSIIASFYLKKKKLIVETNSKKRMQVVEEKFLIELREWIKDWRTDFKQPEGLTDKKSGTNRKFTMETKFIRGSEEPMSKEDHKKLIAKQIRKHYDDWIDMELPALSGLTPRQASNDPEKRKQLIELLKTMENESLHRKKSIGFDVRKIKRKLGIKY